MMRALAGSISGIALVLLELAALALAPFRIGALLRSVSLPRMREHRVRTTLTLLGAALGVGVLVAVVISGRSISRGVNATVDHLAGKADLQIGAGTAGFDESLLDRVRAVPGVYRVTPVVQQAVTVRDGRAPGERLLLLGVDLLGKEDEYFRSYRSAELTAIRRDPLAFLNSETNIILSRSFARKHGYRLHDRLPFATSAGVQEFSVWGFIEDEGVGRAFGGAVAVMYYPALQVAFGRGRNLDRLDVAVEPGADVDAISRRLSAELGEGVAIEAAALRGGRVTKMLQAVGVALGLASMIALGTALFLIYNTMAISVVQRKRELGILRALGVTRGELLRLVMLEGALLGSVAAAVGVGLALLIARLSLRITSGGLAEVYLQEVVSDVTLEPGLIALAFVVGVLGTMLASAIPARQAGRSRPAEVLRTSGVVPIAPRTRRIGARDVVAIVLCLAAGLLLRLDGAFAAVSGPVASLTLLVVGALLIPRLVQALRLRGPALGVEAELASGNVTRDLGRTSSTAAALMAGGALTIAFGAFSGSFVESLNTWSEQIVPGDLFVTSGANVSGLSGRNIPMAAAFRRELAAVPGVTQVRATRIANIEYRGFPLKLLSTETEIMQRQSRIRVLEGDDQDRVFQQLRERGAVNISENLSHRFDLHAGDRIALFARDGTRNFPIAAVVVDYTSDVGSVFMDRATFIREFADDRVDTFELRVRPGASIEQVRSTINERYGHELDLFVLTNREFRGEFVKAANAIFGLLNGLQLVALIVALLGIVNAVLANVLDRVRELGVLRAIGMLRGRLRRLIVLEATLVGAIGSLAAIGVGLGLGYVMIEHVMAVQTGWHLPFYVPWADVLRLLSITLPAAALAGVYPAKVAGDLVVCEALEYE
ncbi:MAG TPA: FtsX-like permease family protein [Polyangiales bacterium]|nr:FtsX-like permease family protein [Polyangiales bacterium]